MCGHRDNTALSHKSGKIKIGVALWWWKALFFGSFTTWVQRVTKRAELPDKKLAHFCPVVLLLVSLVFLFFVVCFLSSAPLVVVQVTEHRLFWCIKDNLHVRFWVGLDFHFVSSIVAKSSACPISKSNRWAAIYAQVLQRAAPFGHHGTDLCVLLLKAKESRYGLLFYRFRWLAAFQLLKDLFRYRSHKKCVSKFEVNVIRDGCTNIVRVVDPWADPGPDGLSIDGPLKLFSKLILPRLSSRLEHHEIGLRIFALSILFLTIVAIW